MKLGPKLMKSGLGLLVLLASACLKASPRTAIKSDDVYLWRYQFLKGDLKRVKSQIRVECRVFDRTLTSEINQVVIDKTESVNARGDAGILEITNSFKTTYRGVEASDDARIHPPILVTMSKSGLIVPDNSHVPSDPLAIGALWKMVMEKPVPDAAVRVGETWRTDLPNLLVSGAKTRIFSTIVGLETVSNVNSVKVHLHMTIHPVAAPEDKDDVSVDGYYNVDPVVGELIRSEYALANVPVRGSDSDAVMRIVVKQEWEHIAEGSNANGGV